MRGPATGLPQDLGGGCRMQILEALALAAPQPVSSLAKRLSLSYMGVKAQCVALEKNGYLASSRHRKPKGRPEVLYRLDHKAHRLLPQAGSEFTISLLEQAAHLFGTTAPLKILYRHFQAKSDAYRDSVGSGPLLECLRRFADLRSAEGHFARLEEANGLCIVEGHTPLRKLFEAYPQAATFEAEAIGRALEVPVRREEGPAGETRFVFRAKEDPAP